MYNSSYGYGSDDYGNNPDWRSGNRIGNEFQNDFENAGSSASNNRIIGTRAQLPVPGAGTARDLQVRTHWQVRRPGPLRLPGPCLRRAESAAAREAGPRPHCRRAAGRRAGVEAVQLTRTSGARNDTYIHTYIIYI